MTNPYQVVVVKTHNMDREGMMNPSKVTHLQASTAGRLRKPVFGFLLCDPGGCIKHKQILKGTDWNAEGYRLPPRIDTCRWVTQEL